MWLALIFILAAGTVAGAFFLYRESSRASTNRRKLPPLRSQPASATDPRSFETSLGLKADATIIPELGSQASSPDPQRSLEASVNLDAPFGSTDADAAVHESERTSSARMPTEATAQLQALGLEQVTDPAGASQPEGLAAPSARADQAEKMPAAPDPNNAHFEVAIAIENPGKEANADDVGTEGIFVSPTEAASLSSGECENSILPEDALADRDTHEAIAEPVPPLHPTAKPPGLRSISGEGAIDAEIEFPSELEVAANGQGVSTSHSTIEAGLAEQDEALSNDVQKVDPGLIDDSRSEPASAILQGGGFGGEDSASLDSREIRHFPSIDGTGSVPAARADASVQINAADAASDASAPHRDRADKSRNETAGQEKTGVYEAPAGSVDEANAEPASIDGTQPETRPMARYQPRLASAGRPGRPAGRARPPPDRDSDAATKPPRPSLQLGAELLLKFRPGGHGIEAQLLLSKPAGPEEHFRVRLLDIEHEAYAVDDRFLEALPVADLAPLLAHGIECRAADRSGFRWMLRARNLHVFAGREGFSGLASVARVVMNSENALLCSADVAEEAIRLCVAAQSPMPIEVKGPGLPTGWRCFRGIRPAATLDAQGMFAALSPRSNAEICLNGGIKLDRSDWLHLHAPQICITGVVPEHGEVLIDGIPAVSTDGIEWCSEECATLGDHVIQFRDRSRTYRIKKASESWPAWNAHSDARRAACGAAAMINGRQAPLFLNEPSVVLGRVPGQVAAFRIPGAAIIAFEPMWILPGSTRRSFRQSIPIRLGSDSPASAPSAKDHVNLSVRRWCRAILDGPAALIHSPDGDAVELWLDYRIAARELWKRYR